MLRNVFKVVLIRALSKAHATIKDILIVLPLATLTSLDYMCLVLEVQLNLESKSQKVMKCNLDWMILILFLL